MKNIANILLSAILAFAFCGCEDLYNPYTGRWTNVEDTSQTWYFGNKFIEANAWDGYWEKNKVHYDFFYSFPSDKNDNSLYIQFADSAFVGNYKTHITQTTMVLVSDADTIMLHRIQ